MSLVLDCSSLIAALFPDEIDVTSSSLLEDIEANGVTVPRHWWLEIGNTLLVGERRKRISRDRRLHFMSYICELPLVTDNDFSLEVWYKTNELAAQHDLTAYDAAYLELAARLHLPLATHDKALKKAAKKCGIKLYEL